MCHIVWGVNWVQVISAARWMTEFGYPICRWDQNIRFICLNKDVKNAFFIWIYALWLIWIYANIHAGAYTLYTSYVGFFSVFSCDQADLRTLQSSVRRLCLCLSVRLLHLFYHVPVIVSSRNFQELLPLTKVMSMQKVKVRGKRSRSQMSWPHLAVSGP